MTTWTDYYKATSGRPPRDLFTRAEQLARLPEGRPGVAIDLGCGDGTETVALLTLGWQVCAIDREPHAIDLVTSRASGEWSNRLQTQVADFEHATLPRSDFVYAGLSLFFCDPSVFPAVWAQVTSALHPGGLFAGHLLGERDSWALNPQITSHTAGQAKQMLSGCRLESFVEIEQDGRAVSGPKHWHLFEVIARCA